MPRMLYVIYMNANFELKTGDILHCSGKRLLSRLIKWATKSEYSHTAMVIEIWGVMCVIDSQKDGTNPRPLEAWLKKYNYEIIVARRELAKPRQKEICMRAMGKSGVTGYDFVTLLIRAPWGLLTGKWLKDEDPEREMVCSEFVMYSYFVENSGRYSPGMVFEYTQAHNFEHKVYVYDLEDKKD